MLSEERLRAKAEERMSQHADLIADEGRLRQAEERATVE